MINAQLEPRGPSRIAAHYVPDVMVGQQVVIKEGPLAGLVGELLHSPDDRCLVDLSATTPGLTVRVPAAWVESYWR